MDSRVNAVAFRVGAFRRRIAWVFVLQFLIVAGICILGIYNVVPTIIVIAVIVITTALAWLATQGDKRFNSATFLVSMPASAAPSGSSSVARIRRPAPVLDCTSAISATFAASGCV